MAKTTTLTTTNSGKTLVLGRIDMNKLWWTYSKACDFFEVFIPASGSGGEQIIASVPSAPTEESPLVLVDPTHPAGTYNVRVRPVTGTTKGPESNQVQVTVAVEKPVLHVF